jgi:hypothetical protein
MSRPGRVLTIGTVSDMDVATRAPHGWVHGRRKYPLRPPLQNPLKMQTRIIYSFVLLVSTYRLE